MQIKNIDHFVITTDNLEKCIAFYEGVCGMKHIVKEGRHALYFGTQKINIHTRPAEFLPAAKRPTCGSLDLCFIVEGKLEDTVKELNEKGIPIELGIVPRSGAVGQMRSVYVRDPDCNLVELSEYV